MQSFITTLGNYAMWAVTIISFWKIVQAYFSDKDIMEAVKRCIIALLALSAIPFFLEAAPTIGENLIKPIVGIVTEIGNEAPGGR